MGDSETAEKLGEAQRRARKRFGLDTEPQGKEAPNDEARQRARQRFGLEEGSLRNDAGDEPTRKARRRFGLEQGGSGDGAAEVRNGMDAAVELPAEPPALGGKEGERPDPPTARRERLEEAAGGEKELRDALTGAPPAQQSQQSADKEPPRPDPAAAVSTSTRGAAQDRRQAIRYGRAVEQIEKERKAGVQQMEEVAARRKELEAEAAALKAAGDSLDESNAEAVKAYNRRVKDLRAKMERFNEEAPARLEEGRAKAAGAVEKLANPRFFPGEQEDKTTWTTGLKRSYWQMQQGRALDKLLRGRPKATSPAAKNNPLFAPEPYTDEERAKLAKEAARYTRQMRELPRDPRVAAAQAEATSEGSTQGEAVAGALSQLEQGGAGSAYNLVTSSSLQSLPSILTTSLGALAGSVFGPAGAKAGSSAGAFVGSASVEEKAALAQYLMEEGVDITDPKALGQALKGEQGQQLAERVRRRAKQRGGAVGTVEAFFASALPALEGTNPSQVSRSGAGFASETLGEAGGEVAGQALAGEDIRFGEGAIEAVAGAGQSAATSTATQAASAGQKSEGGRPAEMRDLSEEELAERLPAAASEAEADALLDEMARREQEKRAARPPLTGSSAQNTRAAADEVPAARARVQKRRERLRRAEQNPAEAQEQAPPPSREEAAEGEAAVEGGTVPASEEEQVEPNVSIDEGPRQDGDTGAPEADATEEAQGDLGVGPGRGRIYQSGEAARAAVADAEAEVEAARQELDAQREELRNRSRRRQETREDLFGEGNRGEPAGGEQGSFEGAATEEDFADVLQPYRERLRRAEQDLVEVQEEARRADRQRQESKQDFFEDEGASVQPAPIYEARGEALTDEEGNSRYEVRPQPDGTLEVVNTETEADATERTGQLDGRSGKYDEVLAEYFAENAEALEEQTQSAGEKGAAGSGMTEAEVSRAVATRSENPVEILDAYLLARDRAEREERGERTDPQRRADELARRFEEVTGVKLTPARADRLSAALATPAAAAREESAAAAAPPTAGARAATSVGEAPFRRTPEEQPGPAPPAGDAGATTRQVEEAIRALEDGAPQHRVVATPEDLSSRQRSVYDAGQRAGQVTPGFYESGAGEGIVIASEVARAAEANGLTVEAQARATYLHEVAAHEGLRAYFDSDEQFVASMEQLARVIGEERLRAATPEGNATLLDLYTPAGVESLGEATAEQRVKLAEEYLAKLAEGGLNLDRSFAQRVLDFLRRQAGRLREALGRAPTDADLRLMLEAAARGLREKEGRRQRASSTGRQAPARFQRVGEGTPDPSSSGVATSGWQDRAWGFLRRQFFSRGDLPGNVFEYKVEKQGAARAALRRVKYTLGDFDRAAEEAYGDEIPPRQVRLLDDVLKGDAAPEQLPAPMRPVVTQMREHIDALSDALIDSGAVSGDLALTIEANKGAYVTRSYRVHDDPQWAENVPEDVRNKAEAFLRKQYPEATEEEIQGTIEELLYDEESSPFAALAGGKLGSKDLSITKQRKDIAEELRTLMGEYRDARTNYVRSMAKMVQIVTNQRFLENVKAEGLGTYLHEQSVVKEGVAYKAQIAAEGSKALEPLNGLYTTPEIKAAFEGLAPRGEMHPVFEYYYKALGFTKAAKTIYAPKTQVRNYLGNIAFAVAQGHWRVGKKKRAAQMVAQDLRNMGTDEQRREYQKLLRLGVIDESVRAGEIEDTFADASFALEDEASFNDNLLMELAKKSGRTMQKAYRVGDDVWKMYAFYNEKARYQKALPNLSEAEIEKKAAGVVRNTYPTYSLVPNAVKQARRFPLSGTFVSFPAEVIRTAYHTLAQIKADLSDSRTRGIGLQRAAGTLVAGAAGTGAVSTTGGLAWWGITAGLGALAGMTGEDDEKVRRFVAPWEKDSQLAYLNKKPGEIQFVDVGYLNPFDYLNEPAQAMLRGEDVDPMVRTQRVAWRVLQPFASEEILTQKLLDVGRNKKKRGGTVYGEEAPLEDKIQSVIEHIYDGLELGAISSGRRIYEGLQNKTETYGAERDAGQEAISMITGSRIRTVDIRQSLYFNSLDYARRWRRAGQNFTDVAKRSGHVTEEELREGYRKMNQAKRSILEQAHLDATAAQQLGVPEEAVRQAVDDAGFAKEDVGYIIQGTFVPRVYGNPLSGRLKGAEAMGNQQDAEELRRRRMLMKRIMRNGRQRALKGLPPEKRRAVLSSDEEDAPGGLNLPSTPNAPSVPSLDDITGKYE